MSPSAPVAKRFPWQVLSSTALKWIAVATMLVDHAAATLVYSYYLELRSQLSPMAGDIYTLYTIMRRIGRIAFPLFCFVLVEGFVHTHSRPKYALRMLLFAIVSEFPYDFALHGGTPDFTTHLNIMFTLLLAFCALWLPDEIGTRLKLPAYSTAILTGISIVGAAGLAGGPLDISYHSYGIVLVGALYLARKYNLLQIVLGTGAAWLYSMEHHSTIQMYSIAGLVLLATYNGTRGRGMKYFFYLFYPLHLLLLGLINMWLF